MFGRTPPPPVSPVVQIWVLFLRSLPLGSTHIKKCLNLGIAQKGGIPGLPKLLGALFIERGNCLIFSYRGTTEVLQGYCV